MPLLIQYLNNGNKLAPGQLLNVYPPLCTKEAANGVSVTAIPTTERLAFLADFAQQIRGVSSGDRIKIKITP
jgi:hypothetical protein